MKLLSLHEILQDAALLDICKRSKIDYLNKEALSEIMRQSSAEYQSDIRRDRATLQNQRAAFTCDEETYYAVMMICEENNTTISAFLRAVCRQLLEEYNYYGSRKSK